MGTNKRGLIMVYTGNGKGKTTAAIGQALRAHGQGYRIYIIHFMKGRDYGEFLASHYLPRWTVVRAGRDVFVDREKPAEIDIELAREGFAQAQKAIFSGEYDLVVLDEIIVAVDYGLIPEQELLQLLQEKPAAVHLVLTGRGASPELIKRADMVSEVVAIKHHYESGVPSCKGIEY
ncbi:MAG: cob(I)yrinic acid a,c-diamide adenosyltransferase [Firmicutes bacterium]|jgi:cob(I)alamin adenosyltransferase|nr:cob(I)yrinic acid a,c-diamide adenosyltransferase [Bacillota bacterium]